MFNVRSILPQMCLLLLVIQHFQRSCNSELCCLFWMSMSLNQLLQWQRETFHQFDSTEVRVASTHLLAQNVIIEWMDLSVDNAALVTIFKEAELHINCRLFDL